jgi:hypothetical protein
MFDTLTDEQLIAQSVELKQQILAIREKRLEIANELRARRMAHLLDRFTDAEKAALKKLIGGSGDVTVTPAPAHLNAKLN